MSDVWLEGLAPGAAVHFMGIGGAGMSALAEAAWRGGYAVTGCDASEGATVGHLRSLGIEVAAGHEAQHVEGAAALIITAAVPPDHPELLAAGRRGLPVVKRAAALGAWVRRGRVIGVSGTHGKTTTTALTTEVLVAAGLQPTAFVGGTVARWDSNFLAGAGVWSVVEADEFDRSFLSLDPDIAIVTNVEADHLDIYGDRAGVDRAFADFLGRLRPGGTVIACADDPGASAIVQTLSAETVTYGLNAGSILRAVELRATPTGTRFEVWERGESCGELIVPVPGTHNVRNALAAAAAARALDVDWDCIRAGLARFGGVGRRFQRVGEGNGVTVVDDYAHHPTEVRATLEAARTAFPRSRLVAVFQPHLFTRTRDFSEAFGAALAAADSAWVTGIYPAREAPIEGVTGELVANAVRKAAGQVRYHEKLSGLPEALAADLRPGDVCLTMGAGSIESLGGDLVRALNAVESLAKGGAS